MKKLFIAAMALATIVSCSKDDADTVLTSKQKSVKIILKPLKKGLKRWLRESSAQERPQKSGRNLF